MELFVLQQNREYYKGCGAFTDNVLDAAMWFNLSTAQEVCRAVNREYGDAYQVVTTTIQKH